MRYHLYSINTGQVFCLDVTKNFSESHKATAVEHPVEDGSPISDHIFISNPKLSVEGCVSDYDAGSTANIDLSSFQGNTIFQDIASLFKTGTDLVTGIDSVSPALNYKTIEFAIALKTAFYDKNVFALFVLDDKTDTVLDHFNTVAIEDLTFSRSSDGGVDMLKVNLDLKQIRTVKIKRTELSNAEKTALDKSVDQQAKSNATKNSSSGSTKNKKSGSKTTTGASASSAFDQGASEGEKAGGDWLGKTTGKIVALGSQTHVENGDLKQRAAEAAKKIRNGGN